MALQQPEHKSWCCRFRVHQFSKKHGFTSRKVCVFAKVKRNKIIGNAFHFINFFPASAKMNQVVP